MTHFHTKRGVPLYVINRSRRRTVDVDTVSLVVCGLFLFLMGAYAIAEIVLP